MPLSLCVCGPSACVCVSSCLSVCVCVCVCVCASGALKYVKIRVASPHTAQINYECKLPLLLRVCVLAAGTQSHTHSTHTHTLTLATHTHIQHTHSLKHIHSFIVFAFRSAWQLDFFLISPLLAAPQFGQLQTGVMSSISLQVVTHTHTHSAIYKNSGICIMRLE